jgi:uncharacterized protein involved in high-affinity Fe2+ transport
VPRNWVGLAVVLAVFVGAAIVLLTNLNPTPSRAVGGGDAARPITSRVTETTRSVGFREYPIGEESRNELMIRAVYLPSVGMEGMIEPDDPAIIHLEADIVAEAGNRQGLTKDAFVPYLKVEYRIEPVAGGSPLEQGTMMPMVASDGLHYGATVAMPKAGEYRLVYRISPPTDTLGRHTDPITGVAPWWQTFEVTFPWDYPGPPALAGPVR